MLDRQNSGTYLGKRLDLLEVVLQQLWNGLGNVTILRCHVPDLNDKQDIS